MGLFDKVKNLFTEEIEEEPQPVKREVRHIEVEPIKPSIEKKESIEIKEEPEEEKTTREEKFVFFSDDDFKDLEKPKVTVEPKKEFIKREEKPLAYKGAIPQTKVEPKREFKPSPIISPVYGVLNKNYQKDEIKTKKTSPRVYRSSNLTVDEVRNKAYGTLEDEIKDDLLGRTMVEEDPIIQNDIDIFEGLDNELVEEPVILSRSTDNVDEIFGKLDNKKDEIIEELDNKKDEILDELDSKKESFDLLSSDYDDIDNELTEEYHDDVDLSKNLLDDEDISEQKIEELTDEEDDTEALAKELEEQKKKLSEINDMMNKNKKATKTKTSKKQEKVEEDLDESELFDLIDSIYEKKDDE